jgi:hypothetical protein
MNREEEGAKLRGAGHAAMEEFQKCGIGWPFAIFS